MAVPARRSAAGPAAPGWGDVRRQMIVSAQACAEAVSAFCLAGGDNASPPALMASMTVSVLQELAVLARRLDVGEAVIAAEIDRAVREDREAWPRPRGGHLRAVR